MVEDASGTILVTWFNQPWLRDRIHPGLQIQLVGRLQDRGGQPQMVNPRWSALDEDSQEAPRSDRVAPVYHGGDDVTSAMVARVMEAILDDAVALLDDHLSDDYRAERALPSLASAYEMVHRPATRDEITEGRRRLAYDEFLLLQLGVMMKRRHRRTTLSAPALRRDEALDERITARFPFELTTAQRRVIDENRRRPRPAPCR